MNQGLKDRNPGCFLAAEDSTNFSNVTKSVSEGGLGFDYKWDMGWMHDTLSYFQMSPDDRYNNYHKLTFSMMYYYNEKFLLPLSHDEVVHGKATILQKMYGDYDIKFPQARAFYMYMMVHPGKKLNFMGNELGQFREWDEKENKTLCFLIFPSIGHLTITLQILTKIIFPTRLFSEKNMIMMVLNGWTVTPLTDLCTLF